MSNFWDRLQQRLARALVDCICRAPRLREKLIEAIAPQVAQRLAVTPVLFGGSWDQVVLGEGVNLVNTLLNVSSGRIEIGAHTFFGHNVCLLTGTHEISHTFEARQNWPRVGHDIVIGRGVWIASNATVIGPCAIGDHAVVAAGAVVIGGELEAGWIYAGVPARKLRRAVDA